MLIRKGCTDVVREIKKALSLGKTNIEFENGDCWRVASTIERSRGIRANYALIDVRTSKEFVWSVIYASHSRICVYRLFRLR